MESDTGKETGPLAKKITIKAEELSMMQIDQTNLDFYIAVNSKKPGEFYINIDGHEAGYKGRLHAGITEGGFVKAEENNTYIYNFEVFATQKIEFDVALNIITGNANFYVM